MIRFGLLLAFLFLPSQAFASFWLECKASVLVEDQNKNPGGYSVMVREAVVTYGHLEKDAPCLEDKTGRSIDIVSKDRLPENEIVDMRYVYHNALGPEGATVTEIWALWPVDQEKKRKEALEGRIRNMEEMK